MEEVEGTGVDLAFGLAKMSSIEDTSVAALGGLDELADVLVDPFVFGALAMVDENG